MSKIGNFPDPAKIWGVPFEVDPSCWGLQVRLISREIIFPRIPTYMTTIPQRYRRTDGRTDGQLALARLRAVINKRYG